MILYDGNYRFLGMSQDFLQKLGYEDIYEFSSYHKDFADILEKENGLIYNFENFSWIDFVLYGGANKDTAIMKTKSGERIKIKLNIQELPLKDDFGGFEKFFCVDIKDEETLEETIEKQPIKSINLSSMLTTQEDKQDNKQDNQEEIIPKEDTKVVHEQEDLNINLSFIKDEDIKEDTKTTKTLFSLDFLKAEEEKKDTVQKEDEPKEGKSNSDEVVLNFFSTTIENEENKNLDDDIQPYQETIKKEELTPPINISLLDDDKKEKKEEETHNINLNFLKTQESEDNQTQEETPTINLNFLKIDDKKEEHEQETSINIEKTKSKDDELPSINLDFLKSQETKEPQQKEVDSTPVINLNFLKEEKAQEVQKELSPKKKEKIIKQIKKDIDEIDKHQEDTITINDNLKSFLKLEKDNTKKIEKETKEKNEEKISININTQEQTIQSQENTPPKSLNLNIDEFLPNIDISLDEKKQILEDFLQESNYNISAIKNFLTQKDINSIGYMAIKIKSSAEILELKDIANIASKLVSSNDENNITKLIADIEKQIKSLEKFL